MEGVGTVRISPKSLRELRAMLVTGRCLGFRV